MGKNGGGLDYPSIEQPWSHIINVLYTFNAHYNLNAVITS